MSSSPPSSRPRPPGRLRRYAARLSLRTRLVAAIVALMAVVSTIVGIATTVALQEVLVRQLDAQLVAAASRSVRAGERPPPGGGPGPGLDAPGQAAGTLGAYVVDGEVRNPGVLDTFGQRQRVSAAAVAPLAQVAVGGPPSTVELGELGAYRVVARKTERGGVVLTGLPLGPSQEAVWWLIRFELLVAGIGLVLAGGAAAAIVRLSLRPLTRVAATASRVAQLPLSSGEVALSVRVPESDTDPRTEVGRVGAALNTMLGHVANALAVRQASETRVRQFVADASHELRTPLAAIRGYAELTRRGRDTVPPDIAQALRRVESEASRMTTLVEDLLLLARLDSGRPLDSEPVDLSALVVDAVSDARVAGSDHRWSLDLPGEAVTVPGDKARLHQVVANLLANARTHTPAGSTVTTTLGMVDGEAVVSIVDNGPGIPPDLLPQVFERFARGDTSRSRAAGSTGLGLAIVSAVVAAHGGRVDVASAPGRTRFAVHLPGATRA
jgi:two-component system, OmpR family, sensor kinase